MLIGQGKARTGHSGSRRRGQSITFDMLVELSIGGDVLPQAKILL
jgi:hypothetical protein